MRKLLITLILIPFIAFAQETESVHNGLMGISEKIEMSPNGSTIRFKPGTYWEIIELNDRKDLTLDFTDVHLLTAEDVTIFTITNCFNIKIIGLSIRHDRAGCFTNCFDVHQSDQISFESCDINGSGFIGICINKSTRINIEKCKIHECQVGVFLWENNETFKGIPASTSSVSIRESIFNDNEAGNVCFDSNYGSAVEFVVKLDDEQFIINPTNYRDYIKPSFTYPVIH